MSEENEEKIEHFEVTKPKGTVKSTKILRWIYIPIIVILIGANAYYYWQATKPIATTNTATTTTAEPVTTKTTTSSVKLITDAGVTWTDPVEITSLNLIKADPNGMASISDAKYYNIATISGGGSIVLVKMPYGMGETAMLRFRKDTAGKYFYLEKNSSIGATTAEVMEMLNNAEIDATTVYGSISSPDIVSTPDGINFTKGWLQDFYSNLTTPTKVAETVYGYIYRTTSVEDKANPDVITRELFLKHADGTVTSYSAKEPFMSDNNIPRFTFADGTANKDATVKHLSATCGIRGGNSIVADAKAVVSLLKENGTASNGDKIYTFKDTSSTLFKSLYTFYKIGRESNAITIDAFLAKNPVTVWKDSFGDYNLYLNTNYGALAECGKPVVYLYPIKTTDVTVKVGADITKSEPAYNNGWTATAKPNGQLTVDGKSFPYLFWEGQGQGLYPTVDAGFIVKKEDIASTIKDHLAKLGLNQKESADFMEFWLPKMPTTPFVRLTWFGTEQMNRLAPLSINPKPDTTIRIFLDFKGLNSSYDIKPQTLVAKKRVGFTVVEWGGLLIK